MDKKTKLVFTAIICAVAFVGIYFLYNALAEDYTPNQFAQPPANVSDNSDSGDVSYTAPDFTVLDQDGNQVRLSDYFGKPIVLNFWASWCYYCTLEMPDFNEAYHNNPDVQFLMVNVTDGRNETLDSAKQFISSKGYDFPVFYDTTLEAASAYGASGLPMTIFIDKDGNLVTYAPGMLTAENLAMGIDMIKPAM